MAVDITHLTADTSTSNGSTTASITPTANEHVILSVWLAAQNAGPADDLTVTGCSLTWTKVATVVGGSRRRGWIYYGTAASPTTGGVTITWNGAQIFQEYMWSLEQATGINGASVHDTAVTSADAGDPATLGDVGTPDSGDGDCIFAIFASQASGSNPFTVASPLVQLSQESAGANVRALCVAWDEGSLTDETPNCSAGDGNSGAIGVIFNGTGAGGGANPKGPLGMPFHGPFAGPIGPSWGPHA